MLLICMLIVSGCFSLQWYDALKAVARLPVGIPKEWRKRVSVLVFMISVTFYTLFNVWLF